MQRRPGVAFIPKPPNVQTDITHQPINRNCLAIEIHTAVHKHDCRSGCSPQNAGAQT
ncbi:MAG: hypothetical protein JST85_25805 [Acidobacteria bacterium]|nr:hypothetical protein [Acidobacteriota bacterium]